MSRLKPFIGWFAILTALLVLGAGQSPAEERDPQLEKIFAAWQERQHWFDAVEFHVTGRHLVPRGSYTDSLPPSMSGLKPGELRPKTDIVREIRIALILDMKKGRHRRETLEQKFQLNTGDLRPFMAKDVFNGVVMKCLIPKDSNVKGLNINVTQPELTIVSGNMQNGVFTQNYFPMFFAIGRVHTIMDPILPGKLRNTPKKTYLSVHGIGVYDNRACVILRTNPFGMEITSFQEYWVDVARESAIVRFLSYNDNSPESEINIQYKVRQDHWLPQSWRWTVFSKGKTLYEEDAIVTEITPNPVLNAGTFDLESKVGMLVESRIDHETRNPAEIPKSDISVYRITTDGETTPVPDPYHRTGDQYSPNRNYYGWAWYFWAIVLIAVVAYYFKRVRLNKGIK